MLNEKPEKEIELRLAAKQATETETETRTEDRETEIERLRLRLTVSGKLLPAIANVISHYITSRAKLERESKRAARTQQHTESIREYEDSTRYKKE